MTSPKASSRFPHFRPLLPLVFLLVLFSSACTSADSVRFGRGGNCQSDRDCLYGLVCRVPEGGSAKRCEQETYGPCETDEDCFSGRRCEKGQCVTECVTDDDCPASRPLCNVGACEASNRLRCVSDGDCGVGEECVHGRCLMRLGGRCLSDFDCPPATRCITGRCR